MGGCSAELVCVCVWFVSACVGGDLFVSKIDFEH